MDPETDQQRRAKRCQRQALLAFQTRYPYFRTLRTVIFVPNLNNGRPDCNNTPTNIICCQGIITLHKAEYQMMHSEAIWFQGRPLDANADRRSCRVLRRLPCSCSSEVRQVPRTRAWPQPQSAPPPLHHRAGMGCQPVPSHDRGLQKP